MAGLAALDPVDEVGGPSSGVAGMITAPSFIAARIVSHSSTWLPSMTIMRSPRRTPRSRSQLAT